MTRWAEMPEVSFVNIIVDDGGYSSGDYEPAARHYYAEIHFRGRDTGLRLVRVGSDNCELRDDAGNDIDYLDTSDVRTAKAILRRRIPRSFRP